jgi:hypothetical protein
LAIDIGHHLTWRFQGIKSCCWLSSIEMVMQLKTGSIYGRNANGTQRTGHTALAHKEFVANKGSKLAMHAAEYGLKANHHLTDNNTIGDWENALRRGPVLAAGKYGGGRLGVGNHVIVIAGVSRTKALAFYNPNIFAVLPHPKDKISYFSLERCLRNSEKGLGAQPFWQMAEDVDADTQARDQAAKREAALAKLRGAGVAAAR